MSDLSILMQDLISTANTVLPQESENDDFNPADFAGGSFDTAYEMGKEHGEVMYARALLQILGIEYQHFNGE